VSFKTSTNCSFNLVLITEGPKFVPWSGSDGKPFRESNRAKSEKASLAILWIDWRQGFSRRDHQYVKRNIFRFRLAHFRKMSSIIEIMAYSLHGRTRTPIFIQYSTTEITFLFFLLLKADNEQSGSIRSQGKGPIFGYRQNRLSIYHRGLFPRTVQDFGSSAACIKFISSFSNIIWRIKSDASLFMKASLVSLAQYSSALADPRVHVLARAFNICAYSVTGLSGCWSRLARTCLA